MAGSEEIAGFLDKADTRQILGWVSKGPRDRSAQRVVLCVDGQDVAEMVAKLPRPSVAEKGHHATGQCGFRFECALIPEESRSGRCKVQVFALGQRGHRIELRNSPREIQWPERNNCPLKLYVLDPERCATPVAESLQANYLAERSIQRIETQFRSRPTRLAQRFDFISGALETPAARRLGLAAFLRAAVFYEPEHYLLRHLLWMKSVGQACNKGEPVAGSAAMKALAQHLAHVDVFDAAQLHHLLGEHEAVLRRQFDNRQTRYLLPRTTQKIGPQEFQDALKQLNWFDLVGTNEQPGSFYRRLSKLAGVSGPAPKAQRQVASAQDDWNSGPFEEFLVHDRALYSRIQELAANGSTKKPSRTILAAKPVQAISQRSVDQRDTSRRPGVCLVAPMHDEAKTLVVLGVSRGGTSLVAGLLRLAGVFMGHKVAHDSHEDAEFHTHDPDQLRRLIQLRNEEQSNWGWKYPHSVEYLGDVISELRNPHFVVIFRDLMSVAQGFHRKHEIPMRDALIEAQQRYGKVARFVADCQHPLLALSYEKAINQREELLDDLADFCGFKLSGQQREECLKFISPGNYVSLPKKLRV